MRKYYKYFILAILVLVSITTLNVDAARGYTYSHKGEPIYSSVGLSVTSDGIYTIISDSWNNPDPEIGQLPGSLFKSPEDLFVYTEDDGKEIIYIVDSASSNLFLFDGDMNYQGRKESFEIKPDDFTNDELLAIKTGNRSFNDDGSVRTNDSRSFLSYINSKGFESLAELNVYLEETPYDDRGEEGKFYITPNGLSGIYRSTRPARDERGFIVAGEYQDILYLADKNNNQILLLDAKTYEVVQVITSPTDASFSGKIFSPVKLVVDGPGMLFVISEGVYEGIMQMTYNGSFSSYLGVNYVSLSFLERIQRRFMTDEQLSQQQATLNTIFTSIAMDNEEFIYTTSRAVNDTDDSAMIKRINPAGDDVLTRNGYDVPKGDLVYVRTGFDQAAIGPSRFTSIAVNDYGVYTVADGKTGRLFTYDDEGYLLYISAGSGNELTNLNNPVAIRYHGDNLLVLDKARQSVLRYEPTDIAKSINKATKYYYDGNLVASSEEWKNVRDMNPNYEYAYIGIGKSLLNEQRYEEAMDHFQRGYSVDYYSRAYKLSRDETIQKYFTPVVSTALVLIGAWYAYVLYKRFKYRKENPDEAGDDFD